MGNQSQIEQAVEEFIRGLCSCRSFTHPFVAQRVGKLWVARDGPRKNGNYRNEEWAALGVRPVEVDRIVRRQTRGRFAICQMHPVGAADSQMREAYKGLGYRLQTTEPLMVHSLKRIPKFPVPQDIHIQRVMDLKLADRLARVTRARQILPEHFENEAVRQYVALADEKIVGWVRSVQAGTSRWCSNMHVLPAYRRRGIARAMMTRMLREDRAAGAEANVLSASHVGARLYPVLGYEHLATLYVYKPRRK